MTIRHVLVVVPARDEQKTIGRSLGSIDAAREQLDPTVTSTVVVVADSCTDDTVEIALEVLNERPDDVVLVTPAGCAGAARLNGTDRGLTDLAYGLDEVWVASTDADTTVGPEWLTTQVAFAADGFVAAAGIVELRSRSLTDRALVEAFRSTYEVRPDGTHPHVHGANMGFRADAYRAAGGWNPLATGEDHDLWNRLRLTGPVVSSTQLRVATSMRLRGRAPDGFANDLAMLAFPSTTVA